MFPNFKNLFKGLSGAIKGVDVPDKDKLKRMFSAPTGGDEISTTNQIPSVEPQARPLIPMIAPEVRTPVQDTQSQIDEIYSKDYSIKKDDQGNVIHRGKDRDKKWSLGDKILSGFMGAFNGDGIIPAATDRNYMERQADKRELGQLVPQVKQQQQAEDFGRDQKYKQSQIEINEIKPEIMQKGADTARLRAEADAEYKSAMAELGAQKARDIREYREAIIKLREQGVEQGDARIRLLEKRIEETIRHNKVSEEDNDLNRQSREKVASMKESGATARKGMSVGTISADKARAVLASIDKTAPKGATAEMIQQKKDNYIKTLSPEVKRALGL
jgi:hypothetical protein